MNKSRPFLFLFLFTFLFSYSLIYLSSPKARADSPEGTLKAYTQDSFDYSFFGSSVDRRNIKSLSFLAGEAQGLCPSVDFVNLINLGDAGVENSVWACWNSTTQNMQITTSASSVIANANSNYLFYSLTNLENLNLSNFNSDNIISLNSAFRNSRIPQYFTFPAEFGANTLSMTRIFEGTSFPENFTFPDSFGSAALDLSSAFYNAIIPTGFLLPVSFGIQAQNMAFMFYGVTIPAWLNLPSGFGSQAQNMQSMFQGTTIPEWFNLPSGFGNLTENTLSMFQGASIPASFIFPNGFGSSDTNMDSMFQNAQLNGSIYWHQAIISNPDSPIDNNNMFTGANWGWNNSNKLFVPDEDTQALFTKIITDATKDNIIVNTPSAGLLKVENSTPNDTFLSTSISRSAIKNISFDINKSINECENGFQNEGAISEDGFDVFSVWTCWDGDDAGDLKITTTENQVIGNANSQYLFAKLSSIATIDFTNFNSQNILSAQNMFFQSGMPGWFTFPDDFGANIENMSEMFSHGFLSTGLTFPAGFGAKAKDMSYMFAGTYLASDYPPSLPSGFGSNAENMRSMFYGDTIPDNFVLPAGFGSNSKDTSYMFYQTQFPSTFSLPEKFAQNSENMNGMFQGNTTLSNIILPAGFGNNAQVMNNMFSNATIPDSFSLPLGFGNRAKFMQGMFSQAQFLGNFSFPENFGNQATNLDTLLSFATLNKNIYWNQSLFRKQPTTNNTFSYTVWNNNKIIVPDVFTRDIFANSRTKATTKNITVQNLPIIHNNAPKFVDISKLAKDFQNAINWLYKYGITTGTDSTHYSPSKTVTRGQMAVFLYREAGSPTFGQRSCGFSDTGKLSAEGKTAVCYLKAANITTGTDAAHYSPNKTVTRGQMATFLYRFNNSPVSSQTSCGFSDIGKLSKEGKTAVCVLKANNVTNGTDKTHYSPSKSVTRVQMAAFLNREYNWIRK
ncbi:MAG: S-layer homology domain-containing protein [Bifidobacteriaceae bacterium]|jgi:hypothetical protein|nr:S-layer homology domain-containing protein [Bifidobacteriaceae bacterium]